MVNHEEDLAALLDTPFSFVESTRYVVKTDNGQYRPGHQMCFGGLNSMRGFKNTDYIVNGIQYKTPRYTGISEEDHKFYLSWLMNDSPFKEGFLDHDVDWSMENKVTFHHLNQPGNLMLAALSSVRAMTETVSCSGYEHFKALVDAGCTKETAFIFMYYLVPDKNNDLSIINTIFDGGHNTWPESSAGMSHVINFINNDKKNLQVEPFYYSGYFTGVQQLFNSENNTGIPSLSKWIIENNKNHKDAPAYNSWGESTKKIKSLTLPKKDMYKYLSDLSHTIYKEWIK